MKQFTARELDALENLVEYVLISTQAGSVEHDNARVIQRALYFMGRF